MYSNKHIFYFTFNANYTVGKFFNVMNTVLAYPCKYIQCMV